MSAARNRTPKKAAAARQVLRLRREIRRHDRLYYEKARPEISDSEYDALTRDPNPSSYARFSDR